LLLLSACERPASNEKVEPVSPLPVGALETVAGPKVCDGRAVRAHDPPVRTLAVDKAGRIFVDIDRGGPGLSEIRMSDGDNSVFVRTGTSPGPDAPASGRIRRFLPGAGRMAADGQGGVFVSLGAKIVRVNAAGVDLSTFAGDPATAWGETGNQSSGDGGPFAEARFVAARSLATDDQDNLYVADSTAPGATSFKVRFINRSDKPIAFYRGTAQEVTVEPGQIQTIAGGQKPGKEQGSVREVFLKGVPPSLAVSGRRLYIGLSSSLRGSAAQDARVLLVNMADNEVTSQGVLIGPGAVKVVARGENTKVGRREGVVTPGFSYPSGIAAAADGKLYLADKAHHRVVVVDEGGKASVLAGTGRKGFNGDYRRAVSARLFEPSDVKVGGQGEVYISDSGNGLVRMVTAAGEMQPATGNPYEWRCVPGAKQSGPPGPPKTADFSSFAAAGGDIYITDRRSGRILAARPNGDIDPVAHPGPVRGVAGGPNGGMYSIGSSGADVRFWNRGAGPVKVQGVLIPPGTEKIVAGTGTRGYGGDGGKATEALIAGEPAGSAAGTPVIGAGGALYIGDVENKRVRRVDASGVITTVAGEGAAGALGACCTAPVGLAGDDQGNLYVADSYSHRVWYVNMQSRPVAYRGNTVPAGGAEPVVGNGVLGIGSEGKATESPLGALGGVALDRAGNLYIADESDRTIKRLDVAGDLKTVAGTGQLGFSGDGLPGQKSALGAPVDLAIDADGNLLILESATGGNGEGRIRRLILTPPRSGVG